MSGVLDLYFRKPDHAFTGSSDPKVVPWIEAYGDLTDRWGLESRDDVFDAALALATDEDEDSHSWSYLGISRDALEEFLLNGLHRGLQGEYATFFDSWKRGHGKRIYDRHVAPYVKDVEVRRFVVNRKGRVFFYKGEMAYLLTGHGTREKIENALVMIAEAFEVMLNVNLIRPSGEITQYLRKSRSRELFFQWTFEVKPLPHGGVP